MSNWKNRLRAKFPRANAIYEIGRGPDVSFNGWGMTTTTTNPPWVGPGQTSIASDFVTTDNSLLERLLDSRFVATQFLEADMSRVMAQLRWRHYIVYWSARIAARRASGEVNLVECGVCDGLTMFYALSAAGDPAQAFLYDAWGVLSEEQASESERFQAGDYAYLSVAQTKKNLQLFSDKTTYNVGYIPQSFKFSKNPEVVHWLHIDLNAAQPTEQALHYFWPRFSDQVIVLFDDYAHKGYHDTKEAVDRFCAEKEMQLLQLPTGQAVMMRI